MVTNKSTHAGYNVDLFAPIIKDSDGKYLAVLSDDSLDRDEERVGKSAIHKMANDEGYLAALIDHENRALNQVAQWINKRVEQIDGHTALIAEPKFFMSNPKAKIIKGMLDEGAQMGISIGAIVKEYEDLKINNKVIREFTDLEIIEASFCGVPANKHGRAMAVAKSFNITKPAAVEACVRALMADPDFKPQGGRTKEESAWAVCVAQQKKTNKEGTQMEKEFTQKDLDSAVEKKVVELNEDFKKQLEPKDSEITKLKKELEDEKAVSKKNETKFKETETKIEEADKKLKQVNDELEKAKKAAIEKQQFANQGGDLPGSNVDIDKEFKEGKLPIMKG